MKLRPTMEKSARQTLESEMMTGYPPLSSLKIANSINHEVQRMEDLAAMQCEACRADAPIVSEAEIQALRPQVPSWDIVTEDNMYRLQRAFKFKNFSEALDFTDKVGALAEEEGHHPAILTEYGKATVTWWTHKIKGLHKNDFIMAAKTDKLL